MSKRTEAIRSLFASPQGPALSADNAGPVPSRVSSGSVRALQSSFSEFERENEELRRRIASGATVLEIDPALIDPSPIADRFVDHGDQSFEALKASIEQRGQEVPVLLRPSPGQTGRYQSAYGHRRVRVARELGRQVKAVLRDLSDEDLVIAQGVENSARQDLSFIERAVFAIRLLKAGHGRSIVQEALAIDRAETSKLISVAETVPADLVDKIGRAPKVGRGRWQALAEALGQPGGLDKAREAIAIAGFEKRETDARFLAVLQAATRQPDVESSPPPATARTLRTQTGQSIARVQETARGMRIDLDRAAGESFAAFLVDQIPTLFEAFAAKREKGRRGA